MECFNIILITNFMHITSDLKFRAVALCSTFNKIIQSLDSIFMILCGSGDGNASV